MNLLTKQKQIHRENKLKVIKKGKEWRGIN